MRKYLIGALFGIALTIASSAFADDIKSLIGMKIQGEFPVTINGQALEKKALIVDGGSYLPVRDMGDALGLDVTFNADMGIELKQKAGMNPMEIPIESSQIEPTVTNNTYGDIQGKIKTIDTVIGVHKKMLLDSQNQLDKLNNKIDKSETDILIINKAIDNIEKTKQGIASFEKQREEIFK